MRDRNHPAQSSTTVVVPVKSFDAAKARLDGVISATARSRLARRMAEHVVSAAAPLRVVVVCDDLDVAEWAGDLGARVMWIPADGLNPAVQGAYDRLGREGTAWTLVAHADLPLARGLADLLDDVTHDGAVVVADRHRDGTNVCVVPNAAGFRFAYGPGSFARHLDEARRCGLVVRAIDRPDLAWDVDDGDDLSAVAHLIDEPAAVPGR